MAAPDEHLDPDIAQALAQAVDQVDPPSALRDRVLRSVGASSATRPRSTTRSAGAFPSWLATAALLAIAVGLSVYSLQLRSRITTLEGELRDAILRADASNTQLAEVRRTASEAQSSVAVLSAPDTARVELAGQTVAPQASGRVFWSRSRGLVFTASNLPALPAGRTYQLWVVTAQAPVSAGLLKPDANGSVNAVFTVPGNIPSATAMAVTIEPEGGMPGPTGAMYLVGPAKGV
jgi:anti-sigma-K factor RskA